MGPQSQLSLVDSPQRSLFAPNLPAPVRSLFILVQARRDRPPPRQQDHWDNLFIGKWLLLCYFAFALFDDWNMNGSVS